MDCPAGPSLIYAGKFEHSLHDEGKASITRSQLGMRNWTLCCARGKAKRKMLRGRIRGIRYAEMTEKAVDEECGVPFGI